MARGHALRDPGARHRASDASPDPGGTAGAVAPTEDIREPSGTECQCFSLSRLKPPPPLTLSVP